MLELAVRPGSGAAGAQELSIISTLERTADNEQCEKVFFEWVRCDAYYRIRLLLDDSRGRQEKRGRRAAHAANIDLPPTGHFAATAALAPEPA